MTNRENLQHKTKEITLFFLVIILLSLLLIMLFPAGLAIGNIGQASLYTQVRQSGLRTRSHYPLADLFSNLRHSNQTKLIAPPVRQIPRSIECKNEKLNKFCKNGTYSTSARNTSPPPITHHNAALGDLSTLRLSRDEERSLIINPRFAKINVVNVNARASNSPKPRSSAV